MRKVSLNFECRAQSTLSLLALFEKESSLQRKKGCRVFLLISFHFLKEFVPSKILLIMGPLHDSWISTCSVFNI